MGLLNEKPVRLLMQDMIVDLGLKKGDIISPEQVQAWFATNYSNVKKGTVYAHLVRLTTNNRTRLHYSPRSDGSDDHFYKVDSNRYRLYDRENDPLPITQDNSEEDDSFDEEQEPSSSREFAYERDLRDFLSRNLSLIETGLKLYEDEGINGIEFPVGGRFIDILAVDSNNDFVVIELKVSKGYDRVIGQLLRYVNWIELNQAEKAQKVRGIIVAKSISNDLILATRNLSDVALYEYDLEVSIKKI